jgi:hypothetical protein
MPATRLVEQRFRAEVELAELERLPHTWDNLERIFHRLWGQARVTEYRKREWAVAQAMLQTLRRNQ